MLVADKVDEYAIGDSLCQDRYSIRTAGPQLEDLMLADEYISVELHSTTDSLTQ